MLGQQKGRDKLADFLGDRRVRGSVHLEHRQRRIIGA
jgi:hypothetical protein